MKRLILNPVFIDTSIFVAHNFNFYSRQFEQLTEFSHEKLIKLISTEITHREILNQVTKLSKSAEDSFNAFIRKHSLVKYNTNSDNFDNLTKHFQTAEVGEICKRNYDKWIAKANVEILPLSSLLTHQRYSIYTLPKAHHFIARKLNSPMRSIYQ